MTPPTKDAARAALNAAIRAYALDGGTVHHNPRAWIPGRVMHDGRVWRGLGSLATDNAKPKSATQRRVTNRNVPIKLWRHAQVMDNVALEAQVTPRKDFGAERVIRLIRQGERHALA